MEMNATAPIHHIGETEQIKENFRKRMLVLDLTDNKKYPQLVEFQFTHKGCEELDNYDIGDTVTVEFRLRGREWTSPKTGETKYFNTLDAFDIKLIRKATPPASANDSVPF